VNNPNATHLGVVDENDDPLRPRRRTYAIHKNNVTGEFVTIFEIPFPIKAS
jgi:hypothetical protein